jgi:segregation and condensation protein B
LFLQLNREEQKSALEALIFASDEALTSKALYQMLIALDWGEDGKPKSESDFPSFISIAEGDADKLFDELINEINKELAENGRPYQIIQIAEGWQFATRPEYGELILRLNKNKSKRRLSNASLEVLAIIAYKQPISKPEVERIRGVNSNEIVNSLLEKGLIRILGRSEALGKPLVYGTTEEFLRTFGLFSLSDLPKLRELSEIAEIEETQEGNSIEIVVEEL